MFSRFAIKANEVEPNIICLTHTSKFSHKSLIHLQNLNLETLYVALGLPLLSHDGI
jgi:hypothetical protein